MHEEVTMADSDVFLLDILSSLILLKSEVKYLSIFCISLKICRKIQLPLGSQAFCNIMKGPSLSSKQSNRPKICLFCLRSCYIITKFH